MLHRKDRPAEQIVDEDADKELSAMIAELRTMTEPYSDRSTTIRPMLPLADHRIESFRRQVESAKLRRA